MPVQEDRDILIVGGGIAGLACGLIAGFVEAWGGTREDAIEEVEEIRERVERIIEIADKEGITTVAAADRYAEQRMAEAEA